MGRLLATLVLNGFVVMGPILQERTTSTILKTVPVKENIKNSENYALITSTKKTTVKISQNLHHVKKASSLHKNVLSGQEKELVPKAEIKNQQRIRPKHVKSPNTYKSPATYKMLYTQFEVDIRHPKSKASPSEWEEKRNKVQHQPLCTGVEQNYAAREKKRHALSLPLVSHQVCLPENVRDLESFRLLDHKEDDTDSASDLSDSERLPVLPSPCTPPQLNLRAEILEPVDLDAHILGSRKVQTECDGYNYTDFLPPPFNTWSLRQLAIFLNTEGKRAPRPKPVGQLEVFLERLLQLEWHQIQTSQNENVQSTAKNAHSRSHASNYPQIASLSRPHTAPPSRLGSPKCMRQSQHSFPFTSSLGSPSSSCQLSRCLNCHVRYPLCNGSCSSYTYQRHSRLSPLLERKTSPITHKRSSSESRASASDNNMARPLYPVSPKSQKKQIKVGRNLQKASQELSVKSKIQPSDCKQHNGRAAKAESHKDSPVEAKSTPDKSVSAFNKYMCIAGKRDLKEGQQSDIGGRDATARVKRMSNNGNSIKGSRADRKLKNAYLSK